MPQTLTGDIRSVASDPALIAAGAAANVDVAVADADQGDAVFVQPSADLEAGIVLQGARVTAAGTVRLRYCNYTAAGIDPAAHRVTLLLVKEG